MERRSLHAVFSRLPFSLLQHEDTIPLLPENTALPKPTSVFLLDFSAFRSVKNRIFLYKLPSLWNFVATQKWTKTLHNVASTAKEAQQTAHERGTHCSCHKPHHSELTDRGQGLQVQMRHQFRNDTLRPALR